MSRDKRKTGIPGSFKYKGVLCTFKFFRLISIHSILHLRRGRFMTKAKLSAVLSSVLCTGLIFFFPSKTAGLLQGKRLQTQTQNKILNWRLKLLVSWRSNRAFYCDYLGDQGCACWQSPGQICVSTEFCARLAKFHVPSEPETCVVFCFTQLPRAERGITTHPKWGRSPLAKEDPAWRC